LLADGNRFVHVVQPCGSGDSPMTSDILLAIAEIFGIFAVGWIARWLGYIRPADLERWSRLIIDFLFPLLVFHSILCDFEPDRLGELWPLPTMGLGMIVTGAVLGFAFRKGLASGDRDLIKTFHHFCAVNNYGFLPIIIVTKLWGPAALARLFLFNIGSSIGYWTVGVALLGEFRWRTAGRKIITPTLVALALALTLSLLHLKAYVPGTVVSIAGRVGAAGIPCMLLLIGAALFPLPSLRGLRDLTYLTIVRLAILPLIFVSVLKWVPLDADVRNIGLIVALMPVSVASTILTRRYGGDPEFAARGAVVTTIASAATVPLWLMLL